MKLVTGNSNRALADAVAAYLELPLTAATVKRFADNEIFVEIHDNVRGEDVFILQSTSYPPAWGRGWSRLGRAAPRRGAPARARATPPTSGETIMILSVL